LPSLVRRPFAVIEAGQHEAEAELDPLRIRRREAILCWHGSFRPCSRVIARSKLCELFEQLFAQRGGLFRRERRRLRPLQTGKLA
jgi:hypothetical protein